MTLTEAQQVITRSLAASYSPGETGAIADLIIEHFTGLRRTQRLRSGQQQLGEKNELRLHEFIARLLEQEPVQYILGEAWFCGLRFFVNRQVLIPRPETEELVEWIISDCRFPVLDFSILDIGTGSGCISVALKRRLAKSTVFACDVSGEALAIAERNAVTIGVKIHLLQLDILDPREQKDLPMVDVIVSNPPYIPLRERQAMATNVTAFEPAIALFVDDDDPLVFYKAIAEMGHAHLNSGGKIYVEISESLGEQAVDVFRSRGYEVELRKDMQGKDRMIRALK